MAGRCAGCAGDDRALARDPRRRAQPRAGGRRLVRDSRRRAARRALRSGRRVCARTRSRRRPVHRGRSATCLSALLASRLSRGFFADSIPFAAAVMVATTLLRALRLLDDHGAVEDIRRGLGTMHFHEALVAGGAQRARHDRGDDRRAPIRTRRRNRESAPAAGQTVADADLAARGVLRRRRIRARGTARAAGRKCR